MKTVPDLEVMRRMGRDPELPCTHGTALRVCPTCRMQLREQWVRIERLRAVNRALDVLGAERRAAMGLPC